MEVPSDYSNERRSPRRISGNTVRGSAIVKIGCGQDGGQRYLFIVWDHSGTRKAQFEMIMNSRV